jgi:hypothetical protein
MLLTTFPHHVTVSMIQRQGAYLTVICSTLLTLNLCTKWPKNLLYKYVYNVASHVHKHQRPSHLPMIGEDLGKIFYEWFARPTPPLAQFLILLIMLEMRYLGPPAIVPVYALSSTLDLKALLYVII